MYIPYFIAIEKEIDFLIIVFFNSFTFIAMLLQLNVELSLRLQV